MLNLPWIYILSSLVGGIGVGFLIYHLTNKSVKQKIELEKQLKQQEIEIQDYKQKVTMHLERTANLLSSMSNEYKNLHEHLTTGSQNLIATTKLTTNLKTAESIEQQKTATPAAAVAAAAATAAAAAAAQSFFKEPQIEEDLEEFKEPEVDHNELDFNEQEAYEEPVEDLDDTFAYEDNPLDRVRNDLDSLLDNDHYYEEDGYRSKKHEAPKDYAHLDH